ncbi:MAG TPA: ribose 5-phosphate isomerase B [Acidobacteriota bacterium]|jgi:ribose 5-phosphate isomerase B|nr:ribose 5-phosphate isomerase B [Acidobacteriota bacterium]
MARSRDVVTAEEIARTPAGTVYSLSPDTLITPLAAELAQQKNIHFDLAGKHREQIIGLGADHGGFQAKEAIKKHLDEKGYKVRDFGTHSEVAVDYPDFARKVAEAVASGACSYGVLVDGAGIGSCMAANKVPGVLAALCYDEATARNSREHNYANVLTLGGKMLPIDRLIAVVDAWLATPYGEARHGRRVQKIRDIEREYLRRR